ncbi:hypothetical protein SAMN02745121_01134 [Nannocystis exedens]|uniref:Uncharacterized protein n=1 Tax=Nannocystis exedens TaxID=54 RepID=A0A1I1UC60_9BACT|nr:hypothetical protein [Nannocystis exedens]PCC71590.1 hypothetical protein NAEX_04667 [Nannocystis exedens]SFD68339.1 hypothetical protein SAMN02745121_01134 [Nannocystis exedens]
MDKHDLILASDLPPHDLELVDLDDLRAAFGGQGDLHGAPEAAAVPPPKTVMCPSW